MEPPPLARVVAGLAFGAPVAALFWSLTGIGALGVGAGVASGVGFAAGLRAFLRQAQTTSRYDLRRKPATFHHLEPVLHQGPANHFKGLEAVGGKLFLTRKRLRFRSHTETAAPRRVVHAG